MLDQADFIARYDKHDALGIVAAQPDQLLHKYPSAKGLDEIKRLDSIVLAGMGGSALAGEFIKNWLGDRLKVPVEIVRDYALPAYVREDTLVVISSYSGNTEETLACLEAAEKAKARIVIMTAGGELLKVAKAKAYPYYEMPSGLQPRLAVLYGVRAWAQMLEGMDLQGGLVDELETAAKWVKTDVGEWEAKTPARENPAKQIAAEILNHPVAIYGGPALALPTMKWKINFNESSKNLAFYYYFSEFNHNEFEGWTHPQRSGFKVIELRSDMDHPQIQKRFDISNRLLSQQFAPIQVHAKGETKLEQMLWTLLLGDFTSLYLAFLNGIDPTPVDLVEQLKKELA